MEKNPSKFKGDQKEDWDLFQLQNKIVDMAQDYNDRLDVLRLKRNREIGVRELGRHDYTHIEIHLKKLEALNYQEHKV